MTVLQIVCAVLAAAYLAGLAWSEWYLRTHPMPDDNEGGDCLTPEDLARMGIVNPDFTVGWIDRTANPCWRQPDAHYNGVPIYWDGWQAPRGDEPIRSIHFGYNSAVPGRDQCGQPSGQEAISPHSVNGLPRGGGPGVRVAPDPGATPSDRASGEATGHD